MYRNIILFAFLFICFFLYEFSFSSNKRLIQRQDSDKFFKEGVYYFNQRDYSIASTKFHQALSIEPEHLVVRYWLGKSYYYSGYVRNALLEWQHLIKFKGFDFHLENKIKRMILNNFYSQNRVFNNFIANKRAFNSDVYISSPISIFIDRDEKYFITSYDSNRVFVLNKYGILTSTISFKDRLVNPYDIVKDSRGDIYISDFTNNFVYKFDSANNFIKSIGSSGLASGEFYGPQGLAIDGYDYLYVVDKGNNRVSKFDSSGDFILDFGNRGDKVNYLSGPTDVCVVNDRVYVSDTRNNRIQVFDSSGNFINSLGSDKLRKPLGIKKFSDNSILVVDEVLGLVRITFKPYNFKIISISGYENTKFTDVAFDNNSFLYFTDSFKAKIPVYIPEHMKYSNFNVEILQSYIPNYSSKNHLRSVIDWFKGQYNRTPFVTHKVKVEDQFGNPVFGLRREHFKVYDRDFSRSVKNVNVLSDEDIKKNIRLVFLNESSYKMKSHKNRVEEIIRGISAKLDVRDEVEVINFNNSYYTDQVFTKKRLSIIDAIFSRFSDYKVDSLDLQVGSGFYHSVIRSYSDINFRGAIVMFISDLIDENSFQPIGYDIALNFAKNNSIPVYIISFGSNKFRDELAELAESSGGAYYDAYASENLYKIVDGIRDFRVGEYYIQYESIFKKDIVEWRRFKIDLNFNDVFGQDLSGYYTYRVK